MPVKIFFCYAHEDEALLKKLKSHLRPLQRRGLIDLWHDREISAGTEWESEIKEHLNSAQIILLLISPDFMDSDYCYGVEMERALERQENGTARVIPVILRHVYWQGEPLGKLQALPTDAKPVTDSIWHNLDIAFYNVTEGIREVVEMIVSEEKAMLRLERQLINAFRADDDRAIVESYEALRSSYPNFQLSPQEKQRIQLAIQHMRNI